jgi:hypothetical protein
MVQPGVTDVHYDGVLSNFSVQYQQDPKSFIAEQVFPTLGVNNKTDVYRVYDQSYFLRDEVKERAPATESAGTGWKWTYDSYICKRWALHHLIADEERSNADADINLDQDATALLTDLMRIKKEKTFVSSFMQTGKWAVDLTGGSSFTVWSNTAAATPITDIENAKIEMLESTGYEPNTLVISPRVWLKLKNCKQITDKYLYTSSDSITVDMVAQQFELEKILIPKAIENVAMEGQTMDTSFIHGKDALLVYVNPRVSLRSPTAGLTIQWNGSPIGGGTTIRRIPNDDIQAEKIEIESYWNEKVVSPSLGTFFSGVVA